MPFAAHKEIRDVEQVHVKRKKFVLFLVPHSMPDHVSMPTVRTRTNAPRKCQGEPYTTHICGSVLPARRAQLTQSFKSELATP